MLELRIKKTKKRTKQKEWTAPEEVGHAATRGKVAVPPAHISDSLLAANVGHAALVGVAEGLDVADLLEAALERLDLLGGLGGRGAAGLEVHLAAELVDAVL